MYTYVPKLRNLLWTHYLGATEYNLQLAESEAAKPESDKWGNSRSTSDTPTTTTTTTTTTRLKSMEQYLAVALSSVSAEMDPKEVQRVSERINSIRIKGYSNAIAIALQRATYWGSAGDIANFEQTLKQIDDYVSQGGQVDHAELEKIKTLGYSSKCRALLADAEIKASQVCNKTTSLTCKKKKKGNVLGCENAIRRIQKIVEKCGTQIDCGVRTEELTTMLQRAHSLRVSHMLEQAKKAHKNGNNRQAKQFLEQAKKYAATNQIPFDEDQAKQILQ
ncbi:hypothetical protein RFI_24200 [Reticulomyxa filosa]|uniref:Uncharacterized protein n=1 Tax=Reticulomyxa filosa TaxID=46433 RepID=X6MJD0_RETFI|nr:hypothetical protein RFI_24200 [Reticulomyxa filosa]|eukprot:ETO13175.1 hypothetical protein RFI_24200 [Reticulomyxa filosa]